MLDTNLASYPIQSKLLSMDSSNFIALFWSIIYWCDLCLKRTAENRHTWPISLVIFCKSIWLVRIIRIIIVIGVRKMGSAVLIWLVCCSHELGNMAKTMEMNTLSHGTTNGPSTWGAPLFTFSWLFRVIYQTQRIRFLWLFVVCLRTNLPFFSSEAPTNRNMFVCANFRHCPQEYAAKPSHMALLA